MTDVVSEIPVCVRCGAFFDTPVPVVTNPDGIREITCGEWCAPCNAFTIRLVNRRSSCFTRPDGSLGMDPRVVRATLSPCRKCGCGKQLVSYLREEGVTVSGGCGYEEELRLG